MWVTQKALIRAYGLSSDRLLGSLLVFICYSKNKLLSGITGALSGIDGLLLNNPQRRQQGQTRL